jgi:hypothetical protein
VVSAQPACAELASASASASDGASEWESAAAEIESAPAALALESLVSGYFRSRGLPHHSADLDAANVAAVFKPFPAAAESRALPGRYVRVEMAAVRAYLQDCVQLRQN